MIAAKRSRAVRADVEPLPALGDVEVVDDPQLRVRGEAVGDDRVVRQLDGTAHRVVGVHLLGHLAADQELVRPLAELLQDADLVLDLEPADDDDERTLDLAEELAELGQLALEQQAGVGGQEVRDALGGGVRAVRGAERVVHVDVREGR